MGKKKWFILGSTSYLPKHVDINDLSVEDTEDIGVVDEVDEVDNDRSEPIDSGDNLYYTQEITNTNNVHTLVMNNCSPCHIPEKGGKKKALDNYTAVKDNLPEIIKRIEMYPGEKGFMPFKRERLNDSTIAVFKAWQAEGMAE